MNKEFIEKLAYMYLDGMSLREIASEVGISHVTVRKKITEDLRELNNPLFLEVSDAIKGNIPKTIRDPEVLRRVLRAYYSLVKENKTYSQIADDEHVSEFVIHRDLTSRLAKISQIAPEIVTPQMIKNALVILSAHSISNLNVGNTSISLNQGCDQYGRYAK